MPGTTAAKNLPYPVGTDRVMDGDDQIRKLAQAVDNMVQAGSVNVNVTTGGTPASAAVTFPVPFASQPFVAATPAMGNAANYQCNTGAPSTTGFTMSAVRNTAGNVTVQWIAVGPVTAVAAASAETEPTQESEVSP